MLKIILEISVIAFLFIVIGLLIYILYTHRINKILKGEKSKQNGKSLEFRLLILSLVGIITIFCYVIVQYSIEQDKYKNFELEISTSIMDFDFNLFYDDLYESSNADADILIGRERYIHIKLNQQHQIEQFSLIVLAPRKGKLIEYAGVLDGNKIIFRTSPLIVNPSVFYFKLSEHIERLSHLDFEFISDIFANNEVNQGLWIDINLCFVWEDEPVTHSLLVDAYSLNTNNSINSIESITFPPQTFIANIWIGNLFTDEQNQLGSIHVQTLYLID